MTQMKSLIMSVCTSTRVDGFTENTLQMIFLWILYRYFEWTKDLTVKKPFPNFRFKYFKIRD